MPDASRDAEKRWEDPGTLRAAIRYGSVVIALAGVALFGYAVLGRGSVVAASVVPLVLFGGGVGALVKTYRDWRVGGTWPIWQGAGWFLLAMSLVALAVPATAMSG